MNLATYPACVEDGRVILPKGVEIPENAKVFVLFITEDNPKRVYHVPSVRLANPEDATRLEKKFVKESLRANMA